MQRMKLSYRLTSGVVLVILLLGVTIGSLAPSPLPQVSPPTSEQGAVGFDPCGMWRQIPPIERLSVLLFLGSLLVLMVQGLRNREAPRWLALGNLITLGLLAKYEWWQVSHCYTKLDIGTCFVSVSALVLMCLHRILRRPDEAR